MLHTDRLGQFIQLLLAHVIERVRENFHQQVVFDNLDRRRLVVIDLQLVADIRGNLAVWDPLAATEHRCKRVCAERLDLCGYEMPVFVVIRAILPVIPTFSNFFCPPLAAVGVVGQNVNQVGEVLRFDVAEELNVSISTVRHKKLLKHFGKLLI